MSAADAGTIMGRWIASGLVSMALVGSAGRLDAQRVTYFGGLSYAAGSYVFDTRSNTFYLSNGLRLDLGRVDFALSAPVVVQDGGLVTQVADGMPFPTGGTQSGFVRDRHSGQTLGTRRGHHSPRTDSTSELVFTDRYDMGLGDPYLSATGQLFTGYGTLRSVSLSGFAKAPLADRESGFGSGAWDVGAGASMVFGVGRALLLLDGAYWWLGDLPELELIDGVRYAVGASAPVFSGEGSAMVMLTGMSRTIETMEPPVSVLLSVSRSVGDRTFLSLGMGVGLTESASDVSVSLGWSVRLAGR